MCFVHRLRDVWVVFGALLYGSITQEGIHNRMSEWAGRRAEQETSAPCTRWFNLVDR